MNYNIAKTIMTSYKFLGKICQRLDDIILQRAKASRHYSACDAKHFSAYETANALIELSERKVELINLKIVVDKVLLNMKSFDAKLLIKRFYHNKKFLELCQALNISERSCYRCLNRACERFLTEMQKQGYGEEKIMRLLKHHAWMQNFFMDFEAKSLQATTAVVSLSANFLGRIANQYKYAVYC